MLNYERGYRDGQTTHEITWGVAPIPLWVYKGIHKYVWKTPNYAPNDPNFLAGVPPKCWQVITREQAQGIRRLIIKEKVIRGHWRITDNLPLYADIYNNTDICNITEKYDLAPLNLLRAVFKHRGLSKGSIHSFLADGTDTNGLFTEHDRKQLASAWKCDAENYAEQQKISEQAQIREDTLVGKLKSAGVPLRTQSELVEEQMATHGRAVITPDVLFVEPTYINGVCVHWLDYKDYIGVPDGFSHTGNSKQIARYTEAFGYGAICYGYSFIEGTRAGALLLSYL